MVKALEALMGQRDRFDYVLIETTGLANPGPVAAALWTDEQLESRCGRAGQAGRGRWLRCDRRGRVQQQQQQQHSCAAMHAASYLTDPSSSPRFPFPPPGAACAWTVL